MAFEDSLQTLVESAGEMIHSTTADGRVTYANPAWVPTLGYAQEEVLGKHIESFVHPEHLADWRVHFALAASGDRAPRFETAFVRRDGRVAHLEGRCYVGGTSGLVFGIFQNVSERKRAEEVLARQADELMRVSESLDRRAREVAEAKEQERRLREAQERAEELGRINEELKAEIDRRRRAEEQAMASLHEKEVLLKEIHHRVKNNLQIISSLLNLQVQAGDIRDPATLEMFSDSQSRIRSMALIHERLYQSDDLATVDFAEYVDSLGRYIFRSYAASASRVRLDTEMEGGGLALDEAIPCGLIVNELLCNSLKYGFPGDRTGRVWVRFHRQKGARLLSVGDDGIGLPPETSLDNPTSLGLRLVSTLVTQLRGTVEVDRSRGTEFRIRF